MKVLKFGGSSIANSKRIEDVIKIVTESLNKNKSIAVIFSAFQGVTDKLLYLSRAATSGNANYLADLKKLEDLHINIARELISVKHQSKVLANLKLRFNELEDVLHGLSLIKELSPKINDYVASFGERLSAYTISETLIDKNIEAEFLDSRELIKTDNSFGNSKVIFDQTNKNIKSYFKKHTKTQIITGFIGSTINNETTTLGRGGSDYSASVFAAALNAKEVQIWTDVDGVMTADPRKVKNAFSINSLSYEEAMELSHFGAKVIHPPTMQPALEKNIPIVIKNTFNPSFKGTLISRKINGNQFSVKAFSSIDHISLIRVEGSGMVGVAGIAERIFKALSQEKINVIMITQASSEHSLCIAVLPHHAEAAKNSIANELQYEMLKKHVNQINIENNLSIIAVVGENMRKTHGISGRIFYALGRNGINLVAIAQGSSELNISMVISSDDESKALNTLHDALFLSKEKTINLFLVGTGLIGGTLLKQIYNQTDFLAKEFGLGVKIIGLANSRRMLINSDCIKPGNWKEILMSSPRKTNLIKFIDEMRKLNLPNSIFVDCTAADEVVEKYLEILNSNISIVTPNKKANSASYKYYLQLRDSALKHNVKFLYETNVGAGLPVINTLKDLVSTGDIVTKIEAVLSGTLSFIFNSYDGSRPFSQFVLDAKEKGYTEPDPRDDLNGVDVARKLLILARELGLSLELKDINVENLVPEGARKAKTIKEFFVQLKKYDIEFDAKIKEAQKHSKVLRYIALLENGKAKVSLQEVDASHPFYSLRESDNIIAFTTTYSLNRPVVVKGPGAGAEVTSAGVFSDIIRASQYAN